MNWTISKRTAWVILAVCAVILVRAFRVVTTEGWAELLKGDFDPRHGSIPEPVMTIAAFFGAIGMIAALLFAPRVTGSHRRDDRPANSDRYDPY